MKAACPGVQSRYVAAVVPPGDAGHPGKHPDDRGFALSHGFTAGEDQWMQPNFANQVSESRIASCCSRGPTQSNRLSARGPSH